MDILTAILLGIIEGVTEFLPVSSTGHLTITEKLLGLSIDDPGVTAFTAIIQIGAIAAVLVYFWKDILRIVLGWFGGVFNSNKRDEDYRFGWVIILGSLPIMVIAYLFQDQVETTLRSLWYVAAALIGWSVVMWLADRYAKQTKKESGTSWMDALIIGAVQCIALIPGISRSGATISAGLFRGFDRVTATRLSFFLAIPALVAAGIFEAATKASDISRSVGWTPTVVATVISFLVAYASIAWLLKYVARHNFNVFIIYRVAIGLALIALLAAGTITAT